MTGDAAIARELRRYHSVPPTFDVAFHLRQLARVFIPALIGAVVIAGSTYLFVDSAPTMYENSVTARIDVGDSAANLTEVTANTLAPPFVALSKSQPVLNLTLKRSKVNMRAEDLAKNTTVAVMTSPSLVQVSARAYSRKDAVALSEAMVESLDTITVNLWLDKVKGDIERLQETAGAIGAQMGETHDPSPERDILKSEYDSVVEQTRQLQKAQPNRIVMLAQSGVTTEVAPKPAMQALVVFLSSLIILATVLAFLRGRVGRNTSVAWLQRMANKRGYALAVAIAASGAWPATAQVNLNKRREIGGGPFVLFSETSGASKVFVESAIKTKDGDTALIPTATIQSEWWRDPANTDRSLVIAVVDTKATGRSDFVGAFDRLDDYELAVQIVALKRGKAVR